ncbi:MAG: glycosyltransferase, partial [Microcystis sp. 53602_E8]|nr:glycosyltransferase [Microcystis sp. 53602_E8]
MPKLSLCMIVKNEAENLRRCLDSVKGVVDEMIVMDTGSTDDTIAIAQSYGAIVPSYDWRGNFSDARNEALKYVTGDWILVLDADEELNAAIVPKMRRAMEKEENLVINLIRHEIGAVQSPYSLISRLFRRHPQVTFTRPYHSIIDDNVAILLKKEPGWKIVELPEIAIFHYGYTVDKIASLDKFERARKAMEGFYQQHPHDPYVCSKLGGLYLKIGRDKEGFKLLKHGLKCHGSNPHILYELEFKQSGDHFVKAIKQPILDKLKLGAYNNFGGLLYEAEKYETALSVFEKTVEIDPSYADGYYNLGLVLKQLHRLPESIKAYKKALKLNQDNPTIYQNLGVAYIVFGSYNEAIEIWQKGLQLL